MTTDDTQKILVVEDDESIRFGLEENLKNVGFDVITAATGPEGLKKGSEEGPDLILLDVMLPEMTGYDVCRKLRDQGKDMPIIMLTARADEFDKLHGFEMGVDDYVTKPFSIKELLARIKAVMARGVRRTEGPSKYEFGEFVLDLDARVFSGKSGEIQLTHTEFDLLVYFCSNAGKALSRDKVMSDVWGTEYYGTQRSLDSFVANLRSKIEKKANKPAHILTVHGIGYKFVM